jgi:CBS domain-containing protein
VIVMMVQQVMTREVLTIGPETPCDKVRRLMDEHRIRHLPVVAGGRLVGIVTYPDLLRAFVRVIETATQERIAVDVSEDR